MKPEIGRRWSSVARAFVPWPLGVEVRRPGVSIWARVHDLGPMATLPAFDGAEAYQTGRIRVISNLENVTPGGWSWHVSVTEAGRRASRGAMRAVRAAFRMQEAEEDNHAPGMVVRSLWLPIDPDERIPCGCKRVEVATVLDAGVVGDLDPYVWRPGRNEGHR